MAPGSPPTPAGPVLGDRRCAGIGEAVDVDAVFVDPLDAVSHGSPPEDDEARQYDGPVPLQSYAGNVELTSVRDVTCYRAPS